MTSDPVTAVFTAIDDKQSVVVPFKALTQAETLPANPNAASETPDDGENPRKERGVWQEHGAWVASAGFDAQGNRIRSPRFETQAEAVEWRAKKISTRTSDKAERRKKVRELSQDEALDAARTLDLLTAKGFPPELTLYMITEYYLKRHPEAKPTTVSQFFAEWLRSKKDADRRKQTLRSAKNTLSEFVRLYGHLALTDVTYEHIRTFVFDPRLPNPNTRRGRGVVVTNFFNNAQKLGKIGADDADHPCNGLILPAQPEPEPMPWPLESFRVLLRYALKTEDQYHMGAYIAIGALAGVRTEELDRLRFGPNGINIDKGKIRVGPECAKKRNARFVRMFPELIAILKFLQGRPCSKMKYVRPLPRPTDEGSRVFSRKLLVSFKDALKKPQSEGGAGLPIVDEGGKRHVSKDGTVRVTKPSAWMPNGLRASFATYQFARSDDAKTTAATMGHTGSLDVFFDHYRALAEKEDGDAFFQIAREVLAEFTGALNADSMNEKRNVSN